MSININIKDFSFFQKLTELPFIETILLHGSRARGDSRDRSDIDLAILCTKATRACPQFDLKATTFVNLFKLFINLLN